MVCCSSLQAAYNLVFAVLALFTSLVMHLWHPVQVLARPALRATLLGSPDSP